MPFIRICIISLAAFVIFFQASPVRAGWLLYHKPQFSGKVIDIDTETPIEGAVVVAIYWKGTMGLGAGPSYSIIEVKESLTDSSGTFHIPSYSTFIQPFSWEHSCTFILYAPGYVSIGQMGLENQLIGKRAEPWEIRALWNQDLKVRLLPSRVVELSKVLSREDRIRSIPSLPSVELLGKLELLLSAINTEETKLHLGHTDPYEYRNYSYPRR